MFRAVVNALDLARTIAALDSGDGPNHQHEIYMARRGDGVRIAKMSGSSMVWADIPGRVLSPDEEDVWYGDGRLVMWIALGDLRDVEIELALDPSNRMLEIRYDGKTYVMPANVSTMRYPHPEHVLEHWRKRWVLSGHAAALLRHAMGLPWADGHQPHFILARNPSRVVVAGDCRYHAHSDQTQAFVEACRVLDIEICTDISVRGKLNRCFAWLVGRCGRTTDAIEFSLCQPPRKRTGRLVVRCGPYGLLDTASPKVDLPEFHFESRRTIPGPSMLTIARILAAMESADKRIRFFEDEDPDDRPVHRLWADGEGECINVASSIEMFDYDAKEFRRAALSFSVPARLGAACEMYLPWMWARTVMALCEAGGDVVAVMGQPRTRQSGVEVCGKQGWVRIIC